MSRVAAPGLPAFPMLVERRTTSMGACATRTTAVAIAEWALALVPLAFFLAGLIVPK